MLDVKKSTFIISLDFELLWGVRDKRTIETYGENIRGVRQVIPSLLNLFDKYQIHASFASVGFLFAKNKEDLMAHMPDTLPNYSLQKYSPYENGYLNSIGISEQDDIYHYGASLINMILQHPGQELASHTFSHYYCLEKASLQSFEEDMIAAKKIALDNYGIDLKSVVFPRNQYSNPHLKIIEKLGFTSFRGNEYSFIYRPRKNDEQNKFIKALRLLDSYINLTGHHCFELKLERGTIVNLPASRFLRPYSKRLKWFNSIRLNRIKNSLTFAAKNKQAYHLWWHPHNFGINLKENLASLEEILKHYKKLNSSFGMQSKSMKEIAEEVLLNHAG